MLPSARIAHGARRAVYRIVAGVVLLGCTSPPVTTSPPAVRETRAAAPRGPALPDRLSDAEFWALVSDISEPGGYFRIEDNYTSNETEVGALYTALRARGVTGGVYMGVGPEQNFTYIASIRPKMAFVVDIRRQAVMQHLMYKAMFELAKDRGDFISILFGKPRPPRIDTATSIQDIWSAYKNVNSDSSRSSQNYARIVERLTKTHGFTFTAAESAQLKAVFDAFFYYGPSITTRGFASGRGHMGGSTRGTVTPSYKLRAISWER